MTFAKIENDICVNIIKFNSKQEAKNFDESLIELDENYGIGDWYKNGAWQKPVLSELEIKVIRKKQIDDSLEKIDETGVTRVLEDIILNTNLYELMYKETKKSIETKQKLREERAKLVEEISQIKETGGDLSAEDNTNEQ